MLVSRGAYIRGLGLYSGYYSNALLELASIVQETINENSYRYLMETIGFLTLGFAFRRNIV